MTPDWLVLGGAFLSGLVGSTHCAAMCGGIATGFPALHGGRSLRSAIEPNIGRVAGYILAGALAGGMGHGIVELVRTPGLRLGLRATAGLLLVVAACRLLDTRGQLSFLAAPARGIWRRLQPLQGRLLPLDSSSKRLAAGVLWGWLPCGLSGTLLTAAWLQAHTVDGAATMAAFGIGTLPMMVPLTWSGARLSLVLQRGPGRIAAGVVVLAAGISTAAAPWLITIPAAHRILAALGCGSLTP